MSETLRALPEIVSGRVPATQVLFPSSSLELIEPIYKNNPVADHFNAVLADAAIEFIAARLARDAGTRLRILEVGAGTGGTTEPLLAALKPYAEAIEEYCYTDISQVFLTHAERTYGATTPYLTYRLLDIERTVAGQEIETAAYDIVIASNVLH